MRTFAKNEPTECEQHEHTLYGYHLSGNNEMKVHFSFHFLKTLHNVAMLYTAQYPGGNDKLCQ